MGCNVSSIDNDAITIPNAPPPISEEENSTKPKEETEGKENDAAENGNTNTKGTTGSFSFPLLNNVFEKALKDSRPNSGGSSRHSPPYAPHVPPDTPPRTHLAQSKSPKLPKSRSNSAHSKKSTKSNSGKLKTPTNSIKSEQIKLDSPGKNESHSVDEKQITDNVQADIIQSQNEAEVKSTTSSQTYTLAIEEEKLDINGSTTPSGTGDPMEQTVGINSETQEPRSNMLDQETINNPDEELSENLLKEVNIEPPEGNNSKEMELQLPPVCGKYITEQSILDSKEDAEHEVDKGFGLEKLDLLSESEEISANQEPSLHNLELNANSHTSENLVDPGVTESKLPEEISGSNTDSNLYDDFDKLEVELKLQQEEDNVIKSNSPIQIVAENESNNTDSLDKESGIAIHLPENESIQEQTSVNENDFGTNADDKDDYVDSSIISISDLLSDTDSGEEAPCSLAASSSGLVLPRPATSKRKKRPSNSSSEFFSSPKPNILTETLSDKLINATEVSALNEVCDSVDTATESAKEADQTSEVSRGEVLEKTLEVNVPDSSGDIEMEESQLFAEEDRADDVSLPEGQKLDLEGQADETNSNFEVPNESHNNAGTDEQTDEKHQNEEPQSEAHEVDVASDEQTTQEESTHEVSRDAEVENDTHIMDETHNEPPDDTNNHEDPQNDVQTKDVAPEEETENKVDESQCNDMNGTLEEQSDDSPKNEEQENITKANESDPEGPVEEPMNSSLTDDGVQVLPNETSIIEPEQIEHVSDEAHPADSGSPTHQDLATDEKIDYDAEASELNKSLSEKVKKIIRFALPDDAPENIEESTRSISRNGTVNSFDVDSLVNEACNLAESELEIEGTVENCKEVNLQGEYCSNSSEDNNESKESNNSEELNSTQEIIANDQTSPNKISFNSDERDIEEVRAEELVNDEVGTEELVNDEVGTEDLVNDEVGPEELVDDEVGTEETKTEVGTEELVDNEVGITEETEPEGVRIEEASTEHTKGEENEREEKENVESLNDVSCDEIRPEENNTLTNSASELPEDNFGSQKDLFRSISRQSASSVSIKLGEISSLSSRVEIKHVKRLSSKQSPSRNGSKGPGSSRVVMGF